MPQIDDDLKDREHWVKYVMSVTLPPVYVDKVKKKYEELTGRRIAEQKIRDIRAGRTFNRLVHTIMYDLAKADEESRLQGSALGKASGQAIGTVRP